MEKHPKKYTMDITGTRWQLTIRYMRNILAHFYFRTIIHALQEIWLRFPMFDPLLLDIHGQKASSCPQLNIPSTQSKDLLYIGTQNGATVYNLIELNKCVSLPTS